LTTIQSITEVAAARAYLDTVSVLFEVSIIRVLMSSATYQVKIYCA
jgi:hypothetical protein